MSRHGRSTKDLILLLALLGSVILTACQPTEQPTEEGISEPAEVDVEEPEVEEPEVEEPEVEEAEGLAELVILQADDPPSLDPQRCGEIPGNNLFHNIYDALVAYDEQGNLIPALATSWEPLTDTHWRYYLREGVTFHNGEPFNAESVKFTVDRMLFPGDEGIRCWDFSGIYDRVEIVDEYTVDFYIKEATPLVPTMASIIFAMPPKHGAEMGEDFGDAPVGTGPYKFVEWIPAQKLVLMRNDDYWGGTPPFERVIFRPVPEVSTRVAELETGGAHLAIQLNSSAAQRLEQSELAYAISAPGGRVLVINFNLLDHGPEYLKDLKVRQALNYAIDKQAIIDSVLGGFAFQRGGIFRPDYFGFDAASAEPYPYDPEKAKQLLEEAGYGDGLVINQLWTTPRFTSGLDVAQAIQAQLEDVGVEVTEILHQDWALFRDIAFSQKEKIDGLIAWQYGTDFPDPDEVVFYMYGCEGAQYSSGFHCTEEFDQMVLEARLEMDPEKRAEMYKDMQQYMRDQALSLWLWQWADIYGINENIEFTPRADQVLKVMEVSEK